MVSLVLDCLGMRKAATSDMTPVKVLAPGFCAVWALSGAEVRALSSGHQLESIDWPGDDEGDV